MRHSGIFHLTWFKRHGYAMRDNFIQLWSWYLVFHVSAFFSSADYLIFDDLMGINAAGNNPPSVKIKVGTGVLLYHQTKQKERHFFFHFPDFLPNWVSFQCTYKKSVFTEFIPWKKISKSKLNSWLSKWIQKNWADSQFEWTVNTPIHFIFNGIHLQLDTHWIRKILRFAA